MADDKDHSGVVAELRALRPQVGVAEIRSLLSCDKSGIRLCACSNAGLAAEFLLG